MESDIIAYIYPDGAHINRAKDVIKANRHCVPPRLIEVRHSHCRRGDDRERQSTEPPEDSGASSLDYLPSLVVRLSDIPRTDKGLLFGSNPNCDVVMNYPGVSNIHFSLTFDEFNCPIIKDLESLGGTQVTYDQQGHGYRRSFRWIIGGHDMIGRGISIVVTIYGVIALQIVIQAHDIMSPAYISAVKSFKRGMTTSEALLAGLGLSQPPTRDTKTPGEGAIHLREHLGEGSFGVVTRLWNVSTGENRVVKAPHPKAIRNRQIDYDAWEEEASIMKLVSHKNITYNETFTIISQCLSALAYLHERNPPIAHRDIKPANILVERRSENGIFVKLGDFGLARKGFELSTLCGTYKYLAPEIHSDKQLRARREETSGYTVAVDIWSLGVVAYELLYVEAVEVPFPGVTPVSYFNNEEDQATFRYAPQDGDDETRSTGVVGQCGEPRGGEGTTSRAKTRAISTVNQPVSLKATTSPHFIRSEGPPPESHSSSCSRITQRCEELERPSTSVIRRDDQLQEGHKLEYLIEKSPTDEFNPLHVGSPLASQVGGSNSQDWASQQNSARHGQLGAAVGPGTTRSSMPRGESGWHNEVIDDYDLEMARAAGVLQTIAQDFERGKY
ncbi:Serine/threonine-protein kinase RAD53 [Beauveria bassiana D1-5]|uniref:IkappaB kinase n=1 Tax=Beauveria bassiana D1-5 TaxID=1245745 RepID=A0A0A2VUJ2_BEABA|nr:Serine/threonine-protein kinase RAD53 [Beauveria bassiana D1-5]